MKSSTKYFFSAVAILLLFWVTQAVVVGTAIIATNLPDLLATGQLPIDADLLARPALWGNTLLAANLVLIGLLWLTGLIRRRPLPRRRPAVPVGGTTALLAFLLVVFGVNFLVDPLDMDDAGTTQLFEGMKSSVPALIGLCLVGPVAEELAYREGIQRLLQKSGLRPSLAIFTTAALFALSHGNLAQGVPALIAGCLLGALYLKTSDIRLCVPAHVLNNSLGVLLLFFPAADSYLDSLPTSVAVSTGGLLTAVGVVLFVRWWKHSPSCTTPLPL